MNGLINSRLGGTTDGVNVVFQRVTNNTASVKVCSYNSKTYVWNPHPKFKKVVGTYRLENVQGALTDAGGKPILEGAPNGRRYPVVGITSTELVKVSDHPGPFYHDCPSDMVLYMKSASFNDPAMEWRYYGDLSFESEMIDAARFEMESLAQASTSLAQKHAILEAEIAEAQVRLANLLKQESTAKGEPVDSEAQIARPKRE